MKQLTLRGFDPRLEQTLRRVARERDISFNKAALYLMRRGAELLEETSPRVVGHDIDHLIGHWSAQEADEFAKATRDFETIEDELWS